MAPLARGRLQCSVTPLPRIARLLGSALPLLGRQASKNGIPPARPPGSASRLCPAAWPSLGPLAARGVCAARLASSSTAGSRKSLRAPSCTRGCVGGGGAPGIRHGGGVCAGVVVWVGGGEIGQAAQGDGSTACRSPPLPPSRLVQLLAGLQRGGGDGGPAPRLRHAVCPGQGGVVGQEDARPEDALVQLLCGTQGRTGRYTALHSGTQCAVCTAPGNSSRWQSGAATTPVCPTCAEERPQHGVLV